MKDVEGEGGPGETEIPHFEEIPCVGDCLCRRFLVSEMSVSLILVTVSSISDGLPGAGLSAEHDCSFGKSCSGKRKNFFNSVVLL